MYVTESVAFSSRPQRGNKEPLQCTLKFGKAKSKKVVKRADL